VFVKGPFYGLTGYLKCKGSDKGCCGGEKCSLFWAWWVRMVGWFIRFAVMTYGWALDSKL
jgi:hypothetical protein